MSVAGQSGSDKQDLRQPELSLHQLAHELSSLVDGSMRSIRLAVNALRAADEHATRRALERLDIAGQSLQDIADVLERAMREPTSGLGLLASPRTLAEEVERLRAAIEPMAENAHVDLRIDLTQEAALLTAGPLVHLLSNGLRNGIEACALAPGDRRVEAAIALDAVREELSIMIADTGPGLGGGLAPGRSDKPDGHGLGLGVCRRIVSGLGGTLELSNVPFGRGAVMQVIIPTGSLETHE